MPNYDLGTAHGQIVIDYDSRGAAQASSSFSSLGKDTDNLGSHFTGLAGVLGDVGRNFGSISQNFGRNFSIMAGGAGILGALTLSARGLGNGLLGLRSGLTVLNALRTVIGGVPKSIQGFPNVLKQIVLLSAGISLLTGGIGILEQLANRFVALQRAVPILARLRGAITDVTRPVKDVAKLILTIGLFITVVKDVLTLTAALAKLSLVIAGIQAGIHIIGGAVVAIEQLSGALLLLPAAGAVAVTVLGTIALGVKGVGAALKTANTPAQLKAQQKALEGLAPAARDFVGAVVQLKPAFKQLQLGVQQQLFLGLGADIQRLGGIYLPVMSHGLQLIAGDLRNFLHQAALFFSFPDVVKDISTILGNVHRVLQNLIPVWDAFLGILLDIGTVGSRFLVGLTDQIGRAAAAFAVFINNARQTGKLAQWIQTGIDAFKTLFGILGQLIDIVTTVFGAFGAAGGGFLNTIYDMLSAVVVFIHSAQGMFVLQQIGQVMGQVAGIVGQLLLTALQELAPIIVQLLPLVASLATDFGGTLLVALKIIGPILLLLATALNQLAPIITPFAGSLLALGVIVLGVGAAFRALWSIITLVTLAIKVIQGVFILFRSVVLSLQVAFWLLDAGVLGLYGTILLFAGIFLIIAAIVVIVVLIIIKYWNNIKGFLTDVWHAIVSTAKTVWGSIKGFFSDLWNSVAGFFTDVWNAIWGTITSIWTNIVNFFKGWGGVVLAVLLPFIGIPLLIIEHWKSIEGFFGDIGRKIVGAFHAVVDWFVALPGRVLAALLALPGIVGNALKWAFTRGLYYVIQGIEWILAALIAFPIDAVIWLIKFANTLKTWMNNAGNWMINEIKKGIAATIAFFVALPGEIINAVVNFGHMFVTWISNAWTGMTTAANTNWLAFIAWLQTLPGIIITSIWHFIQDFGNWIANSWNSMQAAANAHWLAFIAWISGLPGQIIGSIGHFIGDFVNWMVSAWNSMRGAVNGAYWDVIGWFAALPGRIVAGIGDLGHLLWNAGKAIIQGLLNGLKAAIGAIWDFISGIGDKISQLKGPLPYDRKLLVPAGQAIIGGLHSSMVAALPAVLDFVKTIAPKIASTMGTATGHVALGVSTSTATSAATFGAASSAALAGGAAAGAAAASNVATTGTPTVVNVGNLNVQGNLDPTDPVKYRQAMKNIRESLRDLDRSAS